MDSSKFIGNLYMGNDKYILNEAGEPVLEPDLLKWAEWFENFDNRALANDNIFGWARVSTVFLGLDHRFGDGPPVLWETMIFPANDSGGGIERNSWRYTSRQEALEGHQKVLELVLARKAGTDAPKSA